MTEDTRPSLRTPALALAVVATGFALAQILTGGVSIDPGGWPVVGVLLALIIAGEAVPLVMATGRWATPVGSAAALALATLGPLPGADGRDLDVGGVILVGLVGLVAGALLRRRFAKLPFATSRVIRHLLVVALAAVVHRWIPIAGEPGISHHATGDWNVVLVAVQLLFVVALVGVFEIAVAATPQSMTIGSRAALREYLRDRGALIASIGVTALMMTLAAGALGALGVVVFVIPLVLLQFAMVRHAELRVTNLETIRVLSRITEVGGYTEPGHPNRVADLSRAVGAKLAMTDEELRDLEVAALLHDVGQASLRLPLPHGATVEAAPIDQRAIARTSAGIVNGAGYLARLGKTLETQAEPYVEVRERGGHLPIAARVLKVVNAYDDFTLGSSSDRAHQHAVERLSLGLGYEYDPEVVDLLLAVLEERGISIPQD